jgi:hypothetical protein
MIQFFPADAKGVTGTTSIECIVSGRGLLEKCSVISEAPAGHGFGPAALAMSSVFLMRPMTLDGLPVGGASVLIPIKFEADPAAVGQAVSRITVLRAAPWMSVPTAEALSAAFPRSAIGKTATAHVVLRCDFRGNGDITGCETVSETPVDPKRDKLATVKIDIPFDFRDPNQPGPPLEVYDPVWLRRINPDGVAKLFPPEAAKAGLKSGLASVDCTVQHDGSLKDCVVASENPPGMGFGVSALQIATLMAMNPWTAQGDPVDGARIRLPIRLELPADTPAAAPPTKP